MIRPADIALSRQLREKLLEYDRENDLVGIHPPGNLECLIEQLIDSIRRIRYVTTIRERKFDHSTANPYSSAFDPLKGALYHISNGNLDEAFWLIFLFTHFGKNKKSTWGLLRNVYGELGSNEIWTWQRVIANKKKFCQWINDHKSELKKHGAFGNHRKYESLKISGTGRTITTYINLIGDNHVFTFNDLTAKNKYTPRQFFDVLYDFLSPVHRFGRTSKFDYLTMLGKIGLLNIVPNSTYMEGATGPLSGGKLLFTGDINSPIGKSIIEESLTSLENHLGLYYGMQVLEDALCNWQKSPALYKYFSG